METTADQNRHLQNQPRPVVITMPVGTTDQEKAAEYRRETMAVLETFCAICDRAKRDGMVIGFSVGPDQYGRSTVQQLTIVKPL